MRSSPVFESGRLDPPERHLPLVIGGDCPLLLGCLAAPSGRDRVGLLFVDGHEDAYLPMQSSTGEAADMELAFALGMADASWSPELAALLPLVAPTDVRLLGARDAESLRAEGVASLRDRVTLVDGERLTADPAGSAAAACASLPEPWWFHLDLDVLSTRRFLRSTTRSPGPRLGGAHACSHHGPERRPSWLGCHHLQPDLDPTRVHARRIVRFIGSAIEQVSDLEVSSHSAAKLRGGEIVVVDHTIRRRRPVPPRS